MKKRVFLAAGVAVLSAAVLAACSSGNGNKEATKPVNQLLMPMYFHQILRLWIIQFRGKILQNRLLVMSLMDY